jgi:hypothetical protein
MANLTQAKILNPLLEQEPLMHLAQRLKERLSHIAYTHLQVAERQRLLESTRDL